ncbi:bifunctional peptidase and (3S)-lysyl hydroxylase Jmjd7-like [Thrips palmi]|uniref:Bifunctional peptidase and (3S)-lysyl hydroxylase JMJD7 n=1 Tax=Thrips palmi TaxID=161013 RepID=A0A6P9ADR5_THRPL|nr:bifunctional peptidase and (3S)-lysyl hydroxylase Jmjd7-like [Thrips palmi]
MEELFKCLTVEAQEFHYGTSVPEVSVNDISPLGFYRSYVSSNQPVLIRNACRHWPAFHKWNKEYLSSKLGGKETFVAVTPNGYADAVAFDLVTKKEYFVMPEEKKIKFSEFMEVLHNPTQYHGIYYLQRQNSNLTDELPELLEDIEKDIPWATEAFGTLPDAVNFWIGDKRAVTSMHKDPYENVYCVVNGYKDFILHPPTDRPWIPYKNYPTATYREESPGMFSIKPSAHDHELPKHELPDDKYETHEIPWISIDPLAPDYDKYPSYKNASPLHVRVQAGDALFLPSLWYHHVRQSHACIAVNFWYDMQYDVKYIYHKFLDTLVERQNYFKKEV